MPAPPKNASTARLGVRTLNGGMRTEEKLTPQQEAYARARAMGMSISEAVAAIGNAVTAKTASSWESKYKQLRDRIEELKNLATGNAIIKTGLDREYVITRLMNVVERCMQNEPVVDKKGNPTGQYKFDAMGANQALKMLGDTLGMFRQQEKKEGDEYAELSDAEIARIAAELAAQTGLLAAPEGVEEEAGPEQVGQVQAVPEAEGVPQPRIHAPGEALPGGEPAWEDVEFRVRDRVPPDGAVSGVVDG